MKTRVINSETGSILYEGGVVLNLPAGESFTHGGKNFISTGKVDNTMEGDTPIKSYYVAPEENIIRELNERI